jgi:hypothetical protein
MQKVYYSRVVRTIRSPLWRFGEHLVDGTRIADITVGSLAENGERVAPSASPASRSAAALVRSIGRDVEILLGKVITAANSTGAYSEPPTSSGLETPNGLLMMT